MGRVGGKAAYAAVGNLPVKIPFFRYGEGFAYGHNGAAMGHDDQTGLLGFQRPVYQLRKGTTDPVAELLPALAAGTGAFTPAVYPLPIGRIVGKLLIVFVFKGAEVQLPQSFHNLLHSLWKKNRRRLLGPLEGRHIYRVHSVIQHRQGRPALGT